MNFTTMQLLRHVNMRLQSFGAFQVITLASTVRGKILEWEKIGKFGE